MRSALAALAFTIALPGRAGAEASLLPLPYALRLTGQAAFDSQVGVAECLKTALKELRFQRLIMEQKCSHQDRGELSWGPVSQTLVEGVHCAVTQEIVCKAPAQPARAGAQPGPAFPAHAASVSAPPER